MPDFAAVYEDIARRYTRRLASLSQESSDSDSMSRKELERYRAVQARRERKTAARRRNDRRINDEVLRKIEHELDIRETRLGLS